MHTLEIFEPPLCCPTGVCGPGVDPTLAHFAADLEWLRRQGVAIERYNLAQQPAAFAGRSGVQQAMREAGTSCLPLILVNGRVVSRGCYPSRADLAAWTGRSSTTAPTTLPLSSGCCGGDSSSCC